MNEYVPGFMTDEQALAILKSAKFTMERGSAKSLFRQGLFEAMCHAVKALEEKVENTSVKRDCLTCKYANSYSPCDECNHHDKWEVKNND